MAPNQAPKRPREVTPPTDLDEINEVAGPSHPAGQLLQAQQSFTRQPTQWFVDQNLTPYTGKVETPRSDPKDLTYKGPAMKKSKPITIPPLTYLPLLDSSAPGSTQGPSLLQSPRVPKTEAPQKLSPAVVRKSLNQWIKMLSPELIAGIKDEKAVKTLQSLAQSIQNLSSQMEEPADSVPFHKASMDDLGLALDPTPEDAASSLEENKDILVDSKRIEAKSFVQHDTYQGVFGYMTESESRPRIDSILGPMVLDINSPKNRKYAAIIRREVTVEPTSSQALSKSFSGRIDYVVALLPEKENAPEAPLQIPSIRSCFVIEAKQSSELKSDGLCGFPQAILGCQAIYANQKRQGHSIQSLSGNYTNYGLAVVTDGSIWHMILLEFDPVSKGVKQWKTSKLCWPQDADQIIYTLYFALKCFV